MVTEPQVPITLQLAPCSVCHLLFMLSDARQTSPCHGADPILALATLVVGPNGAVSGQWGFEPSIATPPPAEAEAPAPVALSPSKEEAEKGEEVQFPPTSWVVLVSHHAHYLVDSTSSDDDLRDALIAAGVDPEEASTTVGRMAAIRATLRQLLPTS